MRRELIWFGVVGLAALATHFLLVALFWVPAGVPPLWANLLAYVLAFPVSYWGHRLKTFDADHLPHRRTLPRFFTVASLGFLLNEALYLLLLRFTHLDYRVALLLVLVVVAVATFLLSRLWAFYGVRAL